MRTEKKIQKVWNVTGEGYGINAGKRIRCPHLHTTKKGAAACRDHMDAFYNDVRVVLIRREVTA